MALVGWRCEGGKEWGARRKRCSCNKWRGGKQEKMIQRTMEEMKEGKLTNNPSPADSITINSTPSNSTPILSPMTYQTNENDVDDNMPLQSTNTNETTATTIKCPVSNLTCSHWGGVLVIVGIHRKKISMIPSLMIAWESIDSLILNNASK